MKPKITKADALAEMERARATLHLYEEVTATMADHIAADWTERVPVGAPEDHEWWTVRLYNSTRAHGGIIYIVTRVKEQRPRTHVYLLDRLHLDLNNMPHTGYNLLRDALARCYARRKELCR